MAKRKKSKAPESLPATTAKFAPAISKVEELRANAEWAASLASAASTEKGKETIAKHVAEDPWYATDHALPIYATLVSACRLAYSHVFLPKIALGAEPAELLSQSGRWVIELYLAGLDLFTVDFLIHLGRRQMAPVKLGRRSGTCYVALSINMAKTLAEILLNVWNRVPDGALVYDQLAQMDRQFAFTAAHVDRIRSLVDIEFGLGYSSDIDSLFEEVRVGIQQERAVMAPVANGPTLQAREKHLSENGNGRRARGKGLTNDWLAESGDRQDWTTLTPRFKPGNCPDCGGSLIVTETRKRSGGTIRRLKCKSCQTTFKRSQSA